MVLCTTAIFFGKDRVKRLMDRAGQNIFWFRKSDPQSIHIPVAACRRSDANVIRVIESNSATLR
jgi:hypothetical protein